MKSMTSKLACISLLACMPWLCDASELAINDAWVEAAPPVAKTQAAYMTLANNSASTIEIVSIDAKGFGMAMIHKTMQHDGMSMMESVPTLAIPAHGSVTLAPGAMHLMLMEATKPAGSGDKVHITFHYKDGSQQSTDIVVKQTATAGHMPGM